MAELKHFYFIVNALINIPAMPYLSPKKLSSPPPHWRYGPCRTLASFRINFQTSLFLAMFRQTIFNIAQPSIPWPSNRYFYIWNILKQFVHSCKQTSLDAIWHSIYKLQTKMKQALYIQYIFCFTVGHSRNRTTSIQ